MSTFLPDLRYALRTLARAPRFAAVVVLTLALGIGANTSIFSVVYAVMLRPLPYPQPGQLVRITSELRGMGATDTGTAALELFDYQARTDLFSGVAGLYPVNANLTGGDQPERVEVMLVSWNYFSILGVPPQLGRVFGPQDNGPGIPEVAVVSDGYWRRRLGADPQAIGRTVVVDGDPFVLVGVMPPGFRHPGRTLQSDVDLWSPAGFRAMPFAPPGRQRFMNGALARLQNGVTPGQAQAALELYAAGLRAEFPADYPAETGWTPRVIPLQDDVTQNVATTMWILLTAVGLVLLIACVNVANLILARASERQQEIAMRRALGATNSRLARQMLTESAVLAIAAGAVGLALAAFGTDALVALAPGRIAFAGDVSVDTPAIVVTLVLSLITTLLFGLAPVWHLRRLTPYEVVKEGAAGGSGSRRRSRVRDVLVSCEVALAMVLLVGAGLLTRTVTALLNVPVGFETADLLTARVWLPRPNDSAQGVYLRPEARLTFYRQTLARINALPGVEQAAMSTQIPMGGFNPPFFFEIDGRDTRRDVRPVIHSFQVSPGYFETMRIPIVRGRAFTDFDRAGSEEVAIVSAAAARTYWPGDDPVGKRIRFGRTLAWITIVGVSGDVQNRRLDEPAQPILYRSLEQSSNLALALLVRTRGPQPELGGALAREVRAVDPNLPVYAVRTMDDLLAGAIAERQFLMRMVIVFGVAAISLALLGLYAVVSYSVSQRTREIGIRMAMGARQIDVSRLVIREGMRLTAIGIVIGIVAATALTQFIRAQIFGVRPFDPGTVLAALLVMSVTAIVAVYLPARRAARVDPVRALRAER